MGSAYQQITEFTYSNQYLCKQCGKMAFDISIKPCCFFKVVPQKKFFNIIKIIFVKEVEFEMIQFPIYIHTVYVEDLCVICVVTIIKVA